MRHPLDPNATDRALHVCFVTRDIEEFTGYLADLFGAAPPPIHASPAPEVARVRYQGESSDASFKQAFFSWRGTEIEIIEPGPEPSSWRDFLERNGPGIHHLGFTVRSMDATSAELEAIGAPAVHTGSYPGGRYLYADTTAVLGTMIELLEFEAGPRQSTADQSTR